MMNQIVYVVIDSKTSKIHAVTNTYEKALEASDEIDSRYDYCRPATVTPILVDSIISDGMPQCDTDKEVQSALLYAFCTAAQTFTEETEDEWEDEPEEYEDWRDEDEDEDEDENEDDWLNEFPF